MPSVPLPPKESNLFKRILAWTKTLLQTLFLRLVALALEALMVLASVMLFGRKGMSSFKLLSSTYLREGMDEVFETAPHHRRRKAS